ncbi:hypothetical protein VTK73DRAFT_2114 [Phialemonium thermophilum]|uniref:Uncharacterized protein n=1 Tax=Phialemonium thermophilum TaxID=223376 RepID=A0ABR3X6M1_9PEZI
MLGCYIATLVSLAAALPLNINLGAYSPALVVGDGEISFGGKEDVSNLMNVLEGAAVNAAAANAVNANAATVPAADGAPVEQTEGVTIATPNPALAEQAEQIAGIQGLGKEIAPRDDGANAVSRSKRDLAGFDRALTYAEAALVKGPKVQLGTGVEGSGVGIIVDNNPTAAARPGTGAEKRSTDATETAFKRRSKVTTMYVRRGLPASLQSPNNEARSVAPQIMARDEATERTSRRDAIDSVNLNVGGGEGVTLTFVEQVDEDEVSE